MYWFLRGAWNLHLYKTPVIESPLDAEKVFHDFKKQQLMQYLSKVLDNCVLNENIESIFYKKTDFKEYMRNGNNELEKKWRTRILYLSTPRGNIAMYYDAFKLGFSYYSDQNVISYDILNACAMNYVRFYHCLDFFVDEFIVSSRESPLIKLHYLDDEEEKKKNAMEKRKMENKHNNNNTMIGKIQKIANQPIAKEDPFAHFRNYIKKEESKNEIVKEKTRTLLQIIHDFFLKTHDISVQSKTEQSKATEEKDKMKNKFIYLGKMNNCMFSQKIPTKRRILPKFTSSLMDTIVKDSGVQLERMTYNEYKKMQCMTVPDQCMTVPDQCMTADQLMVPPIDELVI